MMQANQEPQQGLTNRNFNMFENEKFQNMFIRSISNELDEFFEGGLHKGMVTQVYGESGCGKSQLAMLFAIGAITRSIPCCFLSTEKELSWNRFTSLAYRFVNEAEFEQSERHFMYKKASDYQQGYLFIQESMERIKKNAKGGLLVIDSVHTFITSCLENCGIENDAFQKSRKQAEIVNRLRWLAKMSGAAILLVNHAADLLDKRRNSSGRNIVPTLGASWELNIDQSVYLTRKKEIRELMVIHSPKMQTGRKKRFRVQNQGFIWITDDGVEVLEG